MIPSLRNFSMLLVSGLVTSAALGQISANAPAPGSIPVNGQTAGSAAHPVNIKARPNLLTTAYPQYLWPKDSNGVATVYYTNANANAPSSDTIETAANANIASAVAIFNADFNGIIHWVPWTTGISSYYVEINLVEGDYSGECEAIEGFQNAAAQPMGGSAVCTVGTILHEMGHIIGLYHEFQRPDRDNYVAVNYNNVIKGSWGNFEILSDNIQTLGLYDYASLMQYPPYSFSRNGGPVIETIPAGIPMANVEGVPVPASVDYSAGDKEAIERLYGAPPTQVTVTSNPVGLQVYVDGNPVTTPQAFAWTLNSTHTLSVADGVQTLSGNIENSSTLSTFYYTYGRWNDNTEQSHTITVLPGDGGADFPPSSPQVATYSANFIQLVPYATSVQPSGAGTVAISPQPQSYAGTSGQFFVARQLATLTATPTPSSGNNFYQFNNGPFWLPGGLGANPKTFYVPDTGNPINTTVYFTTDPIYTVDVTPDNFSSNLSVTVDGTFFYTPVNFTAGYIAPGQSTITWTPGTPHTLAFNPPYYTPEYPYSSNSRYAFSSWNDSGAVSHSISSLPSTSTSYVATLVPQFAPATNFGYPPCGGTATLTPSSPTNDGFYPSGQVLTYTATPEPGYSWNFAGWSQDLTGATSPAQLTATDETLVNANFNIASTPQVLALSGVSPSSAIAGGPAFTLTLNGAGFSTGSLVAINNGAPSPTYLTPTYMSPEELQVQVPSTFIASPGAFQVYVENYPQNESYKGCADFGYQTFTVHSTNLATSIALESSANPATVGTPLTLTATVASAESNATGTVTFKNGTAVLGSAPLNNSGVASYTTSALSYGSNAITATYGGDSNNGSSASTVLTQSISGTQAVLTTPTPSTTLAGPSVTFSWTAGTGASGYWLFLGTTGVGSKNLYDSGETTATSVTVGGLPTTGATIYARLFTSFSGTLEHYDYTYTAAAQAVLTTPAPGTTLQGISVTFDWKAATGSNIGGYWLFLGTTGAGSKNLYDSGETTATSVTVGGLPTTGATIYARLFTSYNGTLEYYDYTYTAAAQAVLTTPTPSGTLPGPTVTFDWTAATGSNIGGYWLFLGTTGAGSKNLYDSGETSATSVTVSKLPTNGSTIYARLFTSYNGTLEHYDYTYTAAAQAVLTTPNPGTTLPGTSVTFDWTAATGSNIGGYWLFLGTTGVGSKNLYDSGETSATTVTVNSLPSTGATIYARVYTSYNGTLVYNDYSFAATGPAKLTSPSSGTVLPGSKVTFNWTAAPGATGYTLLLGTTAGASNLYNSGTITATSATATGLPTNGASIYVTLTTLFSGSSGSNSYTFTGEPAPSYVGFVYTLNSNLNSFGTGDISGYSEGSGSGALTILPSSPYNTGLNAPVAMAVDPAMGLVFSAGTSGGSQGAGLIAAMAINENTGALSAPVFTTPANWPTDIVVGPNGQFLFVSSHQSDSVTVYSVAASGALTQVGSPYIIPGVNCGAFCIPSADSMVYDPVAQTLYVDSTDGWFVATFTVNPTTGALTYVYNEETYYGPSGMAVNPAGTLLYVDDGAGAAVNAYTVTTGAMIGETPQPLTTVTGQPFPAGGTPVSAAIEPTGHYLYVCNNGSISISAYSIAQSGVLTELSGSPFPISGGSSDPQQIAIDQAGTYLYVASEAYNQNQSGGVTQFSINPANGELTQVTSTPVSPGTNANEPFQVGIYPLP